MPKLAYKRTKFQSKTLDIIDKANQIAQTYVAQGFDLTLRQCYYQFVARNWLINNERNYKRLGEIIKEARLAGLIDWEHITDRTRWVRENTHWDTPEEIIKATVQSFINEKWRDQPYRPIVLIEKDALAGVIHTVCSDNDVPYFPCRGYSSISELWALVQYRMLDYIKHDQIPIVLYLGDHDPSGIDMTRDIMERLQLFVYGHTGLDDTPEVRRLGLNMAQIRQYNPPANYAKEDDKRYQAYVQRFNTTNCWELDALAPPVIAGLVEDAINRLRDETRWKQALDSEEATRKQLQEISDRWTDIIKYLRNGSS